MTPHQMTTAAKTIRQACSMGGISIAMLDSRDRSAPVALVRHMIVYHLKMEGFFTMDIADLINRTVNNTNKSFTAFRNRMATDPKIRERYQALVNAMQPVGIIP